MVVDAEGGSQGTVGGGCGEAEVWQEARDLFGDGRARQVHVDLTEDSESDSAKVCGGRFDVFLELWQPESMRDFARTVEQALEEGHDLALLTVLGPTSAPSWKTGGEPVQIFGEAPTALRLAVTGEGRMFGTFGDPHADTWMMNRAVVAIQRGWGGIETLELEGVKHDVFVEVLASPPELVIAGAGHIAKPLCSMGAMCGFAVTVDDDRPEYADELFFPTARSVVCKPFLEAFAELAVTARSHIVLVTRGHRFDEDCLRALKGRKAGYIGMIGSRRRTKAVFADLEAEGVESAWLDKIYAPIGVDIGAETPEEIAISVLAELIKIRRGGKAPSLSLRNRG